MPTTYSFGLERPGLHGVHILIERGDLPNNGDMESGFLDGLFDLDRHPEDQPLAATMADLADRGCRIVAVIRNPSLVIDADLQSRLIAAIAALPVAGTWSIAGGGGLGMHERRHLGLYASQSPTIPSSCGQCPLIDVMPDLYLVDAEFARSVALTEPAIPDGALETVLTIEGYLAGRVAVYLPELSAGIDGDLRARDFDELCAAVRDRFGERLAGQAVKTLCGSIALDRPEERAPAPRPSLERAIEECVASQSPRFSISVVVRTQFQRGHLLERLLSSLSRARVPEIDLEVILSSDADVDLGTETTERLAAHFQNLRLRLQHNPSTKHSRVDNLIGGARAAMGDYVAFIDDDDYVDLFGFKCLRSACFGGQRPLIVTSTDLHAEDWQSSPSGRWVLASSIPHARHPSRGWRDMFSGVNRLPVCALILPRERLIARLECHDIAHDLSEDYALFLLLLTDPKLPNVVEIPETFCHVSIRGQENSVTMPDRRPWARDIAAHLSDLVANNDAAGPGLWQLLSHRQSDNAADQRTIADLNRRVEVLQASQVLLQRENQRLRAELGQSLEVVA